MTHAEEIAAAVEQEREACAQIVQGYAQASDPRMQGGPITYRQPWAIKAAAAIRARGEKS